MGGEPSPGRIPPPLRPHSTLAEKGKLILTKVQTFTKDFRHSISQHDKQHPFPEALYATSWWARARTSLTRDNLEAIHDLAKQTNDADQDYPLTLWGGVPLGVSEPTLISPGIWPTKTELKGEDPTQDLLPPPVGRDNYSSADQFIAEIKQTFREEREDMGTVEGPFTITEAAEYCGCTPEELCPGPMAAIDEGDKVRTIYDGSCGGANAHIQRHTEECTTAPTVMDCVHCLHWLRASCDLSFQTGRCLARTGHGMAHTQTCQDPLSGLAISSGPNWCGMVGQQSGHLRHGKRPTLLGANGSPPQFSPKSTGASSL